MLENDQKYVALFIDWDNLVISTAADFGGASPDLKRIVQKAQQYGTILIAKAYAEWQSTSDKLGVYRAGVEPVYAPTFRFETEATTKGKSLADPCMVADIVDSLHIFSMISTFILVTGDKDLIPVVRLAQLRGKKMVVIGPDFVAGVLRDMADDFVSYRKLIEDDSPKPGPEPTRRHAAPFTTTIPATEQPQQRETLTRTRTAMNRLAGAVAPETSGPRSTTRRSHSDQRVHESERTASSTASRRGTSTEVASAVEAATELLSTKTLTTGRDSQPAADKAAVPELAEVYEAIVELLRQRAEEGKPRLRATNLKDALMQKMSGFSERRYGFSKFKDLLTAAEAIGLLKVRVAGPVHWVSLPDRTDEETVANAEPETADTGSAEETEQEQPEMGEMVRFIQNLRERSRWLTYTYLLTNMISHFAKTLPQNLAESRSRWTLNWLVQEGVLRIDKEPQEVEVAGAKHRVRMCHLEEDDSQVRAVLEAMAHDHSESGVASPLASASADVSADNSASAGTGTTDDSAKDDSQDEAADTEKPKVAVAVPMSSPAEAQSEPAVEMTPTVNSLVEPHEPIGTEVIPADSDETVNQDIGRGDAPTATGSDMTSDEAMTAQPTAEATTSISPVEPTALSDVQTRPAQEAPENGHGDITPSREQVFTMLASLVRDNTGPKRPRMGAAGLKTRLVKTLGSFDEHTYGFSRFKDFLLVAESEGYVRLETVGQITWVLPHDLETPVQPAKDTAVVASDAE